MKKPGYRTTEFWLSFLALLVGAALSSGVAANGMASQVLGGIAVVLGALGYTVPRAVGKIAEIKAQSTSQAAMAVQQLAATPHIGDAALTPADDRTLLGQVRARAAEAERIARPSTR